MLFKIWRYFIETNLGPSINDVIAPVEGKWICDDITKALALKSVTVGVEVLKNCNKMHDVIYGRPFKSVITKVR